MRMVPPGTKMTHSGWSAVVVGTVARTDKVYHVVEVLEGHLKGMRFDVEFV